MPLLSGLLFNDEASNDRKPILRNRKDQLLYGEITTLELVKVIRGLRKYFKQMLANILMSTIAQYDIRRIIATESAQETKINLQVNRLAQRFHSAMLNSATQIKNQIINYFLKIRKMATLSVSYLDTSTPNAHSLRKMILEMKGTIKFSKNQIENYFNGTTIPVKQKYKSENGTKMNRNKVNCDEIHIRKKKLCIQ
ncbi:hypothetical protein SNEBB_007062 [Seison nebaliae]|nr:hypothetical protein SNEBB_007062 [Seison nebaliae]